jgi:hypothetical protein
MKRKLFLLTMLITLYACEDRQPTNPLIQGYDVPIPELQNITAVNDQTAELKWSYTDERATSFQIYRGLTDKNLTAHALTDSFITTWQDSGLVIDTTYYYQISARFDENESELSNTKTVMTSFPGPSSLTAQAISDQNILLTWKDSCNFELGYRLERESGNGFMQIAEIGENVTEYSDSGLTYGTTYQYRIRAFTHKNLSHYSNQIEATMEIPIPNNLSAQAIDDQSIRLTWTDNCDFETGYRIEVKTDNGAFETLASLQENSTEFIHTGVLLDTKYEYRVFAFTQSNVSKHSNTAVAIISTIEGMINGIWKVTETSNYSSTTYLRINETLTFSESSFNGELVTGNVVMFTVTYGNVTGTFNYNPSIGSLFLEFSQSPTKRTYKNATFSTTTLAIADNDYTYTLTKQ